MISMFPLPRNLYIPDRGSIMVLTNINRTIRHPLFFSPSQCRLFLVKREYSERFSSILNRILQKIGNKAFKKGCLPGTI